MWKYVSVIVLVIMGLTAILAFAGSETIIPAPNGPNDPAVNPDANACFKGGVLEGKCSSTDVDQDGDVDELDQDWMWTAGWYLIRYQTGRISRKAFPQHYAAILPGSSFNPEAPRPTYPPPTATPGNL